MSRDLSYIVRGATRIIDRVGQEVTYRKVQPGTYNATTGKMSNHITNDIIASAHVRSYTSKEITGLINVGDREVRMIGDDDSILDPKEGDQIKIGSQWFRVVSVDRRYAGDDIALNILHVTGK
jgi:hypothetical protein